MEQSELLLYQFPISHYCEKIRWALDYKGLAYQAVNVLPGKHIKIIKSIAPRSSVPVLRHGGQVIQNSREIITYLDEQFADKPLTPLNESEREQAQYWEDYVDKNIGPQLRLYCYHYLLDYPKIIIPVLTQGQNWFNRRWFTLIFPKVRDAMRSLMKINADNAREALLQLEQSIERLNQQRQQSQYLVGDKFSRADLAAAALLAPLCRPKAYGVNWQSYPDELEATCQNMAPKLEWVGALYQQHR